MTTSERLANSVVLLTTGFDLPLVAAFFFIDYCRPPIGLAILGAVAPGLYFASLRSPWAKFFRSHLQ